MRKNKFVTDDMLTTIDVLNTLMGGRIEPQIEIINDADGRELRFKVPGIDKHALSVEIHNNTLTLYYLMAIQSNEREVMLPQIIYNKVIPYYVDSSKIEAVYHGDDDVLVVRLPFNGKSSGYHKKIIISHE